LTRDSILEEYNELLIKNYIKKSEEALSDAVFNFENKEYSVTLNRVYYSIFYSVSALASKNNFITSKHTTSAPDHTLLKFILYSFSSIQA
jgi:uncharacterized protein (UPF0332 family)